MKYQTIALLAIVLAVLSAGCDNPSSSGSDGPRNMRGVWDMRLAPEAAADADYTITVEVGGGSGAALVSLTGPSYADTARVTAGVALPVGPCGVTITFGNTAGFNLVAGDNWSVLVSGGNIGPAFPGDTVASTVGPVTSGGAWTCAQTYCDGSALSSVVPDPGRSLIGRPGPGGQWYSVAIAQNYARVTAAIPEQQAVTLYLGTVSTTSPVPLILPPLVMIGDSITVTYRRATAADGENGDFFRVIAVNGSKFLDAEYLTGAEMTAGDTMVSFTFAASSPEVQIDFIAGLSDVGERVVLDAIEVRNQAGVLIAEGFESGPALDCGVSGANVNRFEPRLPAWRVGSLCVSALNAPAGAYALRFEGGATRQFSGSIISNSTTSGLASMIGGLSGLLDSGSGLEGLFAQAWEPVWTGWFTSFAAAQQSRRNLVGAFKGEAKNHACVESGQITASVHQSELTDLSAVNWVLRLSGQVVECEPALEPGDTIIFGDNLSGDTLSFGDTLGTTTGDTVQVIQLGAFVLGRENAIDDWGNEYSLRGALSGNLINLSFAESNGLAVANAVGVVGEDQIIGALTGRLVFDSGRVCRLEPGATIVIDLVPK